MEAIQLLSRLLLVALMLIGTASSIRNHGKPHDPYDGLVSFVDFIVVMMLLLVGGFFSPLGG